MKLTIGTPAPNFSLPAEDGEIISLNDFLGKKVVLYFYPKDFTPGCTKQACSFRDAKESLKEQNIVILGISRDSSQKHWQFQHEYRLPFKLLSDVNGKTCEAYGVLRSGFLKNTIFGLRRMTFLIDENGNIAHIWHRVKIDNQISDILEIVESNKT